MDRNQIQNIEKMWFFQKKLGFLDVMRDATVKEQEEIQKYINSISVDIGISFFDID